MLARSWCGALDGLGGGRSRLGRRDRAEGGLQPIDLGVLVQGDFLELVAEGAAGVFEALEGLIERGALVGGRAEMRRDNDTEQDIVEGVSVAVRGQDLRGGAGGGVGGGEQRRQGVGDVVGDGAEVRGGLALDGVGGFPAVDIGIAESALSISSEGRMVAEGAVMAAGGSDMRGAAAGAPWAKSSEPGIRVTGRRVARVRDVRRIIGELLLFRSFLSWEVSAGWRSLRAEPS